MSGLQYVEGVAESRAAGGHYSVRVTCPSGKTPISGGARAESGNIVITGSHFDVQPTDVGWVTEFDVTADGDASVRVQAVCITAQ